MFIYNNKHTFVFRFVKISNDLANKFLVLLSMSPVPLLRITLKYLNRLGRIAVDGDILDAYIPRVRLSMYFKPFTRIRAARA